MSQPELFDFGPASDEAVPQSGSTDPETGRDHHVDAPGQFLIEGVCDSGFQTKSPQAVA